MSPRLPVALIAFLAAGGTASAAVVKVVTIPPGADVYYETLKLGTTTEAGLLVRVADDVVLTIEKPGYATVRRSAGAGTSQRVLEVRLTPLQSQAGTTGNVPPPAGEGPAVRSAPRAAGTAAPGAAATAGGRGWSRWTVLLSGAYTTGRDGFETSRTFSEFAEEGHLSTDYAASGGFAFEGGLQFLFTERFGAAVSLGVARPESEATFTAAFPHPFFFDRDRLAEGAATGLDRKETAFFLDLVVAGTSGRLGWRLFAGPSWQKVDAGIVDSLPYTHAYPYDEVTPGSPVRRALSESAFGFGAGAGADFLLAQHFALGLQLRFSHATVSLEPEGMPAVDLDVGGLQVGLTARIPF